MISFHRQISKNFRQLRGFTSSTVLSSKKEEEKYKYRKKVEDEDSKGEIASKLNNLLQSMVQKDNDQPLKEVKVTQAVSHRREKKEKEKPFAEKLAGAAKDVASSLGGDTEKTESELLNILLRRKESSSQELGDVLKGIKVEKSPVEESRAQQVRSSLSRQYGQSSSKLLDSSETAKEMKRPRKKMAAQVDILGAQPTSYFKNLQPQPPPCELRTWQSCVDRDLRLAVTHPPANIYEQLIQWTDRGIIWKFPIDNEQGLEDEKKISFEEHIFLEEHLEDWCPNKGPIRHFMELVCVGLSKNHWLTAEEKRQHIFWYRDYFADKKALIQEIGAGEIKVEVTEESKQLSP